YLGGRDDSGQPPANLPKDIFFARIRIVEILEGAAVVGQTFEVRFAFRGDARQFIYPYTPDQLARDYFSVIYVDPSAKLRRLVAFQISRSEYERWKIEESAYTRLRGKPGFRE